MKLSALKGLVKAIEDDAKQNGLKDPNVTFWLSSKVEAKVVEAKRSAFIETEPDCISRVHGHRIVTGPRSGYTVPLNLSEP